MKPSIRIRMGSLTLVLVLSSFTRYGLASPFSTRNGERQEANGDNIGHHGISSHGEGNLPRSGRSPDPIMDILWSPNWSSRTNVGGPRPPTNVNLPQPPFKYIPSQDHAQHLHEVQHYADMQMLPRNLFPPAQAPLTPVQGEPPSQYEDGAVNLAPLVEEGQPGTQRKISIHSRSGSHTHTKKKHHKRPHQQQIKFPDELSNLDDPYTALLLNPDPAPPQKSPANVVTTNPYQGTSKIKTAKLSALLIPTPQRKKTQSQAKVQAKPYQPVVVSPSKPYRANATFTPHRNKQPTSTSTSTTYPTYPPLEAETDPYYDYDNTYSQYDPDKEQPSQGSYKPQPLPVTTVEPYHDEFNYSPTPPTYRPILQKRPSSPLPTLDPYEDVDPTYPTDDYYTTTTTTTTTRRPSNYKNIFRTSGDYNPTPTTTPPAPYADYEEVYTQSPYPIYKYDGQLPQNQNETEGYEQSVDNLQDLIDDGYTYPPPEAYDVPYNVQYPIKPQPQDLENFTQQYPYEGQEPDTTEGYYDSIGRAEESTQSPYYDDQVDENYIGENVPTTTARPYMSDDKFRQFFQRQTTPTPYYDDEVTQEPYVEQENRYVDLSPFESFLIEQPFRTEQPYTVSPYENADDSGYDSEYDTTTEAPYVITYQRPRPRPSTTTTTTPSPTYVNSDVEETDPYAYEPTTTMEPYASPSSGSVYKGPSITTTPSPKAIPSPSFTSSTLKKHTKPLYMSALQKAVALQQQMRRGGVRKDGSGYVFYRDYQYAPRTSSSEVKTTFYGQQVGQGHIQLAQYPLYQQQQPQRYYQVTPYHVYQQQQQLQQLPLMFYSYGQDYPVDGARAVRKSVVPPKAAVGHQGQIHPPQPPRQPLPPLGPVRPRHGAY